MHTEGRLHLFGTARWVAASLTVELPDSLPSYLLAYLAYRADWVGRDTLIGLFWPNRLESEALHNLRTNLHRTRTLLAGCSAADAIEAQPRRVRLALPSDVAEFRLEIGRGNWSSATELQPQPLLTAWSFRGFALLEEWAHVERAALTNAWRSAAMKAAQQHELSGHTALAAQTLLRMLEASDEPTEDAVQALLRVAGDAGQRDAALAQYERLLCWLRDGLGLAPMPLTRALVRTLRQEGVALPASAAPAAVKVPRAVLHPPQMIGRERERQRLADDGCKIIFVAGEPGVGKTRLLEEALPNACWIACREGLEQVPFAPLAEWIDDQRDCLPETGEQRRDLARLVPALLDGEQLPPADAATAKPRLLLALAQLLEGRRVPLVFDDLQWADAATRELIVLLANRATVALRLTYRSNEVHEGLRSLLDALDAGWAVDHIELAALAASDLLALLVSISHVDVAPSLFGAWLHRRTGGNPFFVLQTLRSLFESGRLVVGDDGWASALDEITRDYSELHVPPRVADLIRRRVQNASESARRVLMVIAVAGDARAIEAIANTAGLSPWAAAEAIAELQAGGLLREHRFAHDLVRQSVYRAAPDALRTVLHAGVARQFVGLLRAEQIAEHWWQAGEIAQALQATVLATATQCRAGLHDEALALASRALSRVTGSADRARLQVVRARIRLEQGESSDAEADAMAVLDEAAEPHDRAEAYLVISSLRIQQGRIEDARQALLQAAVSDPDHDGLLIESARVAELQGRVADVVPALEQRCAQLRHQPPGNELLKVLTSLGGAYNELGDAQRGVTVLQEAWRLAERLNSRYVQVEAAINLLWGLSALERNDEAVAIAEEALALGEYDSTPTLRNNLCWSLRELGRIDEAMRLCEQLAAGRDPTLALIAQARLIDMRFSASAANGSAWPLIDAMLAGLDSTDIYVAHTSAARTVLRHGSREQVDQVLRYLKPQPIDRWMHRELHAALTARGLDPLPHIGAKTVG